MIKKLVLAAAVAAPVALTGCTSQDIQTVLLGINAACVGASALAPIAVIVTSSIGGSTKITGGTVAGDVTQSCASLEASTQAVINSITAAGGTATVVVQSQPAASARHVLAKVRVWRDRDGVTQAVYVVKPSPGILGTFTDIFTQLD